MARGKKTNPPGAPRSRAGEPLAGAAETAPRPLPAVGPAASAAATSKDGEIVALSLHRARLARGRRLRRVDAIFELPDPGGTIRSLPGDEFYYLVQEAGVGDALEILVHATAEQIQTALDFALWDGDRLDLARLDEWLGPLTQAPPEKLAAWLFGVDVELLALILRKRARIHDLSTLEEGAEPEVEGVPFRTPDGFFLIDLLGEGDAADQTRRMIDALYRRDLHAARRLLVGVAAETDAELEETELRWRNGRMSDLGFVEHHEALAVYRELDPTTVRIGTAPAPRVRPIADLDRPEALRLPGALVERLRAPSPFARAIAAVTDREVLAEVHAALVALANRVLAADRVRPGDDERVAETLERMAATLDLGIEFLTREAGGADARDRAGADALRTIALPRIFQVGVSLAGKVRRLARALQRDTPFARLRPPVDLLEPEDVDVVAALTALRPVFPRSLETPPAAGTRPFGALADVALATAAVERAAASISLLLALGVRPEQLTPEALSRAGLRDAAALDAGVLARTILVGRLLGGAPAEGLALPPEAVREFKRRFNNEAGASQAAEDLRAAADALLAVAAGPPGLSPAARVVAARWIDGLTPLLPVLTTRGLSRP